MAEYLIDENLPDKLQCWSSSKFIHVSFLTGIRSDEDIWQYALKNNVAIITKDTDFYNRYRFSILSPKIVWIRTGNIRKKDLNILIEQCWAEIEKMLLLSSFVIIDEEKIEGF